MQTNALPVYDASDNATGCCPRFHPDGWDDQALRFENKPFVKATTRSAQHVPLDMAPVFKRTFAAIENAGAAQADEFLILSRDLSASEAEHYFAVSKPVPGLENVSLNGDYLTKVFEGPYENTREWRIHMVEETERRGRGAQAVYFFYTTCPGCSKVYGHNYVVAVAELGDPA